MNRGKNKVTAGVLGILCGGLGIHHFYLGSTMAGVILLIATILTCGAASIVSLVEGIMILIMPDAEFDARYNQREPESMEFVFMKPKGIA